MPERSSKYRRPGLSLLMAAGFFAMVLLIREQGALLQELSQTHYGNSAVVFSLAAAAGPASATQDLESAQTRQLRIRLAEHGLWPISCASVLEQYHGNHNTAALPDKHPFSEDPNKGRIFARLTTTNPSFVVSVHNEKYDRVRWSMFDEFGQYYEQDVTRCFREIIAEARQEEQLPRVLDVGSNIGWFALFARSQGAEVASFEPNSLNYLRTCESMCFSGWLTHDDHQQCLTGGSLDMIEHKRLHIFPYAVSDVNATLHFVADKGNPGASEVKKEKQDKSVQVQAVKLDDVVVALGWKKDTIHLLKVDVEGQEENVFAGAVEILKSGRVKNVLMEGNVGSDIKKERFRRLARQLTGAGFRLHQMGGWPGPSPLPTIPQGLEGEQFVDWIVTACGTDGRNDRIACNLWWKMG